MAATESQLHLGFAPWMVAGVRTQWDNMRPHVAARTDIAAHVVELHPYRSGGALERLPLPSKVRGNLRTTLCANELFSVGRLDALWTHDMRAVLPFLLTKAAAQRTVVVFSSDSTSDQQASFGTYYAKAASGPQARLRDALDSFSLRRADLLNPWSQWAARSFEQAHGIDAEKIRVLPPGIDLERWPFRERRMAADGLLRLLFVGGDFERKGGHLLLDVYRQQLQGQCELHLVTREPVPAIPGVFVYDGLQPNDAALRALYDRCDVFVLPTNADCFSLASLEAMATGLPVITTTVGGIPEIVSDASSGYLISPGDGLALTSRLRLLAENPALRRSMGMEGRQIVERRFDAARNTAQLLHWILELIAVRGTGQRRSVRHT